MFDVIFNIKLELGLDVNVKLELGLDVKLGSTSLQFNFLMAAYVKIGP